MTKEISLQDLATRVEKLERAVFSKRTEKAQKIVSDKNEYSGATGGVRLLAKEGFFDRKRYLGETRTELEKRGYLYSAQAVQMPLTRLSKVGGPLVCLSENGRNAYAKRK